MGRECVEFLKGAKMKKKLFALTAVLGLSVLASWAPSAEAVGYCSSTYCAGKPATATCG